MRISVRPFAVLRELLGGEILEVEVPQGTTVAGLWEHLTDDDSRLIPFNNSVNFAINSTFVARETELCADDEVVFLPPVSGG